MKDEQAVAIAEALLAQAALAVPSRTAWNRRLWMITMAAAGGAAGGFAASYLGGLVPVWSFGGAIAGTLFVLAVRIASHTRA